jgi:hypothetical protein
MNNLLENCITPNTIIIVFDTYFQHTELRQQDLVAHVLETTRGRLSSYPWDPSVRDVVSIGFVVGEIPKYETCEHFTNQVRSLLAQKYRLPIKRVHVQCVLTRVSAQHKGRTIRCQAFDIQLRRDDVPKFAKNFCEVFPGTATQRLMLYRDRHQHAAQQRSICRRNSRPPTESSPSMASQKPRCSTPRVSYIKSSKQSTRNNPANQPVGRWNVLCTETEFHALATDLYKRLPKLFLTYLVSNGNEFPEGAEPVTLTSNFRGKPTADETSTGWTLDSDRDRYYSNWTAGLADFQMTAEIPDEVLQQFPRENLNIPNQVFHPARTWAQVAGPEIPAPNF